MKKGLKIVLISVLSLLIVAAFVFMVVLPTTFDIDESLIESNADYSVELVEGTKYTTLKKTSSGDFKVMAFTDMHLDANREEGSITLEMMIRNIVAEKPDFVVLLGDCITAAFTGYRAHQLCKIFEELGVYWTYTLGNHEHDNAFCMTRDKLMNLFASYEHCVADPSIKFLADGSAVWGNSNDVVVLQDKNGNIVQSLIMLDSGQDISSSDEDAHLADYQELAALPQFINIAQKKTLKAREEDPEAKEVTALSVVMNAFDADYIKETQVNWYKETLASLKQLNNNVMPKSTIFEHIPQREFLNAYVSITGNGYVYDANETTTVGTPSVNDYIIEGKRRENVCSSIVKDGLWDAIKEANSTQAIFCGHDHVNDFSLMHDGIIMGYCQPSGYSSYNTLSKKQESFLIQGYSIYSYDNNGTITVNDYMNKDKDWYSDLQSYIHSTVRH